MPPDDPVVCLTCGDAGMLRQAVPLGHPAFGKAFPCPACTPPAPVAVGIPERLAGATFESFDLKLNPQMRPAVERCRAVAEGREWSALLSGDIGTGKSHLAVAALALSVHPKPGRFWSWSDLTAWLTHQMYAEGGPRRPEAEVLGFFAGEPFLLVLDDIGAEKATEWKTQALYQILDGRYARRLPTILTTNAAGGLDARVLSRFYDGTVVCSGKDVRAMKGARR